MLVLILCELPPPLHAPRRNAASPLSPVVHELSTLLTHFFVSYALRADLFYVAPAVIAALRTMPK